MPTTEHGATATAIVAAGWSNPNNGFRIDGSYASTSTSLAEQTYSGYSIVDIGGSETIDKVYARIKHYISIVKAALGTGDSAEVTCTLRIYDGSSWQNYQITNLVYSNASPATDEQLTVTASSDDAQVSSIDVTSFLNTHAKLANAQVRLLFTVVTAGNGITVTWYVDGVTLLVSYSPSTAGTTNIAITADTHPKRAQEAFKAVEDALEILAT